MRQDFSSGPHRLQFLGLLHCSAAQGSSIDFLTNWVEAGRWWYFTRGSLQPILLLTGLRTEGESVLGFLLFACLLVLLLSGFCSLVYVPESAVFREEGAGKSLVDL